MYLASILSTASLLLLPFSTHASPELLKRNYQNTCASTRTIYTTCQTITTSKQPSCPTVTVTGTMPNGYHCPYQTCGRHDECEAQKTVDVQCPAKCCPKQTPTVTERPTCTTTCQEGCRTQTHYKTATDCDHDDNRNDYNDSK